METSFLVLHISSQDLFKSYYVVWKLYKASDVVGANAV